METSIYDSDIENEKLDKKLSENPELEVLKFYGEIDIEVEADLDKVDVSFDAHNLAGDLHRVDAYDYEVSDLKVYWSPDEGDLDFLKECVDEGSLSKKAFELFKQKVLSEPRNTVYEISSILTKECIEELEEKYKEEHSE